MTDRIKILDIWGEGRIYTPEGIITGFQQAHNINKRGQKVSNGPKDQIGTDIPNLCVVEEYENPKFLLGDDFVPYITVMGAPITPGTAREMYRVLDKQKGVVILYGMSDVYIGNFEANMQNLIYKPQNPLGSPFNEPNIAGDVRIYGFPNVIDHNEL